MIKLNLTEEEVNALLVSMLMSMKEVEHVIATSDDIPDGLLHMTEAMVSVAEKLNSCMPKKVVAKTIRFDC